MQRLGDVFRHAFDVTLLVLRQRALEAPDRACGMWIDSGLVGRLDIRQCEVGMDRKETEQLEHFERQRFILPQRRHRFVVGALGTRISDFSGGLGITPFRIREAFGGVFVSNLRTQ